MWLSRLFAKRDDHAVAHQLVTAVAGLPIEVRRAMLEAVGADEIIVGAYTDRRGRVCPMLAAHRRGARSDVGAFPRAWDAFGRARRPRAATPRELEILTAILQESVTQPDVPAFAPAMPDRTQAVRESAERSTL
jgi:hypothetical protein